MLSFFKSRFTSFVQTKSGVMKLKDKTINRLNNDYGKWVLITGATSGIGKEMATVFAAAGFSLVITGRRTAVLNEMSTFFSDNYGTKTVISPGDLSVQKDVEDLIESVAHLPVNMLILNAGFGSSGQFISSDIHTEIDMLAVNCKAVMILTHHFANKIKLSSKKGAIVLLSSIVAFQGVPNASHYSATKAYIQSMGEGLSHEFKPYGIDLLCAAPGPVNSGFSKRANMRMGKALKPSDVAVPIINSIGIKRTVFPGWFTKFLMFNLRLTPRWGKIRIMKMVMAGFTKHQK